jgi:hypothetical protein
LKKHRGGALTQVVFLRELQRRSEDENSLTGQTKLPNSRNMEAKLFLGSV